MRVFCNLKNEATKIKKRMFNFFGKILYRENASINLIYFNLGFGLANAIIIHLRFKLCGVW